MMLKLLQFPGTRTSNRNKKMFPIIFYSNSLLMKLQKASAFLVFNPRYLASKMRKTFVHRFIAKARHALSLQSLL